MWVDKTRIGASGDQGESPVLRAPVQVSVTALDAVVRRENLGEMHLAIRAEPMWRDDEGEREDQQRAMTELAQLGLAGPRGLDPDLRATIGTLVRPAEEFFGWLLTPEGTTAVLAVSAGPESLVAVRNDDLVTLRPIRPGGLAETIVSFLPAAPAARGRSYNVPESAITPRGSGHSRDEGFGGFGSAQPQENPEITQLEKILTQQRIGAGELHAAVRDRGGRRHAIEHPVSYFDTPEGRWMTRVAVGRDRERWLIAAPGVPQALVGALYDMQRELLGG